MPVRSHPKVYHIVHVDRLASIVADGYLWCDAEIVRRNPAGTTIGMTSIKRRRLTELTLNSHPNLLVGACVPFYFCPRSVMLFVIHQANHPELAYRGGQWPIVHLEADLHAVVGWAEQNDRRWAFTLSNAGAYYFEDRNDLSQLAEIDWDAVRADRWGGPGISPSVKEGKQAEFLIEQSLPWDLVERIGVHSQRAFQQAANAMPMQGHRPPIEIRREWYYL
jgi:hypothetical protein